MIDRLLTVSQVVVNIGHELAEKKRLGLKYTYRIAGYFRGVLIFVNFVTSPGVTKFCTHEVFQLRYKLLVLLLT